jgi:hypothetical protein
MNPIIEELKQSLLVKECGYSLELAAETYDDMNDNTYYQDALKETAQ